MVTGKINELLAHSNLVFWANNIICFVILLYIGRIYADDAFIFFSVSENIISGYGPVLNEKDSHLIATSPLWLLLVTVLKAISSNTTFLTLVKVVYLAFYALASWFIHAAAPRDMRPVTAFVPYTFLVMPHADSYVGMDVGLVLAALSGCFWAIQSQRFALFSVLAGLAYLARGEGILVLGAALVLLAWKQYERGELSNFILSNRRLLLRPYWWLVIKYLSLCAAPILIWHIYLLLSTGTFLPESLNAKVLQGLKGDRDLFVDKWYTHIAAVSANSFIFFILIPLGCRYIHWIVFSVSYCLAHFIGYWYLSVAYYSWYYYDVEFVLSCIFVLGVTLMWQIPDLHRSNVSLEQTARHIVGAIAMIGCAWFLELEEDISRIGGVKGVAPIGEAVAESEAQINYRAAARHINERATDAKGKQTVLAEEIGVLSYYLDNKFVIRDIAGLASPNVSLEIIERWGPFIQRYVPDWIVAIQKPWGDQKSFLISDSGEVAKYHVDKVVDPEAGRRPIAIYRKEREEWLPRYAPGETINFKAGGEGNTYAFQGWSVPATDGTWTNGESAVIGFYIPKEHIKGEREEISVEGELKLHPFLRDGVLEEQRVVVRVNGMVVAERTFRNGGIKRVLFKSVIDVGPRGAPVVVEVGTPDAASFRELGLGSSGRDLGIKARALVVDLVDR